MMNLRSLLLFTCVICLSGTLLASVNNAEKRLQTAIDEVLAVANSSSGGDVLAENLRPVLKKHLSFDAMTRRAVGPGWRQFSDDQQDKATDLFTTLIIRTYSNKLTPGEQPNIKFKPASEPASGRVDIPTTLLYQGSDYEVTYRMEQAEGWRITDVVIEGVSLVANYRAQLDAQFKKGGSEAIISSLIQSVDHPK
ncbi:MAG: MlaC/ttg2D family ABC transporter substrate-binding protein [Chthoniobacterales bacterium]